MKNPVNSPCVVCGAERSRELHALPYPEEGYPGLFVMRECDGCGLLFNSPRLSDARIEQLYDGNYYVFRESERQALRRVEQLAAQTIGVAAQFTDARRLLEVGCAKGYLLALLKARGWDVRGVELSSAAADFARERFDVPVHAGTLQSWLRSAEFAPSPLLLSTDVIEHVTDPLAFVQAMHDATAERGWLVVGTPNADSDHRLALGTQWIGFNPFHIFLFNRANLGRLLQRAGFDVVQAYTYTNGDPPAAPTDIGLRRLLRGALRGSGLLGAARRVRDGTVALLQPRVSEQTLAPRCDATGDDPLHGYLRSDDARSERRSACRGDNLVMIARRRT